MQFKCTVDHDGEHVAYDYYILFGLKDVGDGVDVDVAKHIPADIHPLDVAKMLHEEATQIELKAKSVFWG